MAAVLDALASSLSRMLTDMVKDEAGMLLGVSGEIEKLESKLCSVKDFLTDAERKRFTDRHVQRWVGKLKDVMYDAEDVMDLCQLKAMKRQESMPVGGGDVGCFNGLLFCMRNPLAAYDIGRRIRELNQRLEGIKEAEEFNFINLTSYEDHHNVVPRLATRKTAPGFDQAAVVGEKIEEDARSLMEMLVKDEKSKANSSRNINIVAIVGVGGIGKTTLAQMVFNNETIEDKFDKKIWLSINKDFDEAELLRITITAAGGDHRGDKEISLLQPNLTTTWAGKKIFLVMDDVWSDRAWNDVLRIPLTNAAAQGSGILVTTRDARVARGMKAVQPYHHVDKLGYEDSWCLLKNQVALAERDEIAIEMLKTIGLEIIKRCDGLPLAVKAIGGLLSQRDINKVEWEKVLKNPLWSVKGMPEDLNHAIYISYEDLTPCLRQCFMHISLLPKSTDFEILRKGIVAMWVSEGFLHGSSNELEELGEEYFKELISRNLIEPIDTYIDQTVCTMHDVVRSFAHYVSRDEALVFQKGHIDFGDLDSVKIRRLSIEIKGSRPNELDWSVIQKQKSLRTLMLDSSIKFKPHDSLSSFSMLRILYIMALRIDALVDSLCELKHLRYLGLISTDISRLPEGIGNMKFLQYILLKSCENNVQMPGGIIKLGQLRGLYLPGTKVSGMPRGFGGLTNLKSLIGFPAHMDTDSASAKQKDDWCSLEELGPISQLRQLQINDLENVSASSFATKANLVAKEHLTDLSLRCTNRLRDDRLVKEEGAISQEEKQQIECVFDELCPPPCLDKLDIKGYFGHQLPRWMMLSTSASTLKSLRFLFLDDLACCTQLPDGLCQIPNLEFIQIRHAPAIKYIGPNFVHAQHYHHRLHRPSERLQTFPRLCKLKFLSMVEWEEWEWEGQADVQAMPFLEELVISRCKLKCVPPGLTSHVTSLSKLWVGNTQRLESLDKFASVIMLNVVYSPNLVRIADFPKLQKLSIISCPKLKVLEDVPALLSLELEDYDMKTLPEYLRNIKPGRLELDCSLELLTSLTLVSSGPVWDKISHIERVKAYAKDRDRKRGWYLLYKRDPYSLETNITSKYGVEVEDAELAE